MVNSTPRSLYPQELTSVPTNGGWVGNRAGLKVLEKRTVSCPYHESNRGPSSSLRSHCTDYATPATYLRLSSPTTSLRNAMLYSRAIVRMQSFLCACNDAILASVCRYSTRILNLGSRRTPPLGFMARPLCARRKRSRYPFNRRFSRP